MITTIGSVTVYVYRDTVVGYDSEGRPATGMRELIASTLGNLWTVRMSPAGDATNQVSRQARALLPYDSPVTEGDLVCVYMDGKPGPLWRVTQVRKNYSPYIYPHGSHTHCDLDWAG